jgi:phage recombination protein Bet
METFEHPFGDPVPGEAVKPTFFNPTKGYRPKGHYTLKTYGSGYTRQDAGAFEEELPMNTTALAVQDPAPVTSEQLELIKRTVAVGATADELKLYLFDCQRQGVHPLDKLVHFTKRAGKYTPITSIDFMRIRAADTGEYAGSDDATFSMLGVRENEAPLSATVTVWRLVQGQRASFTATARWSEYKPDQNDFMWKKMPHTMLAKCAEALALRKGFPRQLAGLYAKEEMDQAGSVQTGAVVEAPAPTGVREKPSVPNGGELGTSLPAEGPDLGVDLPAGALRIISVGPGKAGAAGEITFHKRPGEADKANLLTWNQKIVGLATEMCQAGEPCFVGLKRSTSGNWRIEDLTRIPKHYGIPTPAQERADEDAPF